MLTRSVALEPHCFKMIFTFWFSTTFQMHFQQFEQHVKLFKQHLQSCSTFSNIILKQKQISKSQHFSMVLLFCNANIQKYFAFSCSSIAGPKIHLPSPYISVFEQTIPKKVQKCAIGARLRRAAAGAGIYLIYSFFGSSGGTERFVRP